MLLKLAGQTTILNSECPRSPFVTWGLLALCDDCLMVLEGVFVDLLEDFQHLTFRIIAFLALSPSTRAP